MSRAVAAGGRQPVAGCSRRSSALVRRTVPGGASQPVRQPLVAVGLLAADSATAARTARAIRPGWSAAVLVAESVRYSQPRISRFRVALGNRPPLGSTTELSPRHP